MTRITSILAIAAATWPLLAAAPTQVAASEASDVLAGPIPAEVEEVIDGDTLRVRAHIWLGQDVAIHVRLAGIDAPEARGGCTRERELAAQAERFVTGQLALTEGGRADVLLRDVRYGKYARRVVARVETEASPDLGAALLAAGLAQPYSGGRRPDWCE